MAKASRTPQWATTKPLSKLHIMGKGNGKSFTDYSVNGTGAKVDVVFRNHVDRLVDMIDRHDVVVGCVAWLTHKRILTALSKKRFSQIVVQKEDFLRPDLCPMHMKYLRALYESLSFSVNSHEFVVDCEDDLFGFIGGAYGHDFTDGVRCLGNANNGPAGARMHHKFAVFCDLEDFNGSELLRPMAVWTGSFNFTVSAERSLENALLIHNEAVAMAYLKEWAQVYCFSEALDWTTKWARPDFSEANT